MGGSLGLGCCFFFTFLVSFLLQAVGFFICNWVNWKGCEAQGLFGFSTSDTTNDCIGDGEYISTAALGLQATSFAIHLLVCVTLIWLMCCSGDDEDDVGCCGCCAGYSIMLYPAAGLFSIIGCGMMSAIDVPDFSYDWSFILCLTSGIYVIIQVILACYWICKVVKDNDEDDISTPSPRQTPTTVATTDASGQMNLGYGHQKQHVAVAVTEREELAVSNGVMILRKMRIMHVVGFVR